MEKPTSIPDLASLMESLSVNDNGSAAEEALSTFLGVEVPLDAGVEGAAGYFARKLGLHAENSVVQTTVFVLTKAAILETAQLVGIGGGLAQLNLMSFHIAQLKKQAEEINKKLDIILSTPLKLALDFFGKALRHMENESIPGLIKEMEKVKDHAMQAFHYVEGQGPKTANLKSAVLAKQLVILAEILILSYDGKTIVPFSLLKKETKRTIGSLVEDEIRIVQQFHESQSLSMFTLNKAEKVKKKQDIMDNLLKTSYPFISEGKGFTSALAPLVTPFNLKVLPKFLPDGQEDAASLIIGQHEGRPLTIEVWKESEVAFCNLGNPQISAKILAEEGVLTFSIKGQL